MRSQSRRTNRNPIISLLTDFGLIDPFVAEMKAVILSICPQAKIIDVSHEIEKFDIRMGAFTLAEAAPCFPTGTIHVAVVDPGVGSSRRAIVVETRGGTYVGPDNGLLMPAAEREGIAGVFEITNRSFMREPVSSTFHGRDIFASTAAHLANGRRLAECGPMIQDYMKSPFQPAKIHGGHADCEVMHIDSFGNVITNLTRTHFSQLNLRKGVNVSIHVGRKTLRGTAIETYADLRRGQVGLMIGSHDFVELACRESNAARRLGVRRGSVVRVSGF